MRHAVVIIHGIGEQKPMDTLRGFVSTLVNKQGASQSDLKFYSKPDELSNLFELRRLTTASSDKDNRIKTDFFEYYWAYTIREPKLQQVLFWIGQILLRWPGSLPRRIRPSYYLLWAVIIAFAVLSITGHKLPFIGTSQPLWLGIIGTLVTGLISYLLTSYIGDAARYTSANPGNIAERQKIRKDGITLLKSLHDSGKYEKIILVGHSLGSIIGYDLIRHLWSEYNEKYQDTKYADDLVAFEEKYANRKENFNVDQYQADQENLFYQQNSDGNPWRISHFITLGSPLTHASFLLANNTAELYQRMDERELPKCPPVSEFFEKKDRFTYRPDVRKNRRVLHHAAPFACTQWINVYYRNDFVGGNLSHNFGPGVKEHEIRTSGSFFLRYFPYVSHTHYWSSDSVNFEKCKQAADILKKVIWG